jgi:hypothetical protein
VRISAALFGQMRTPEKAIANYRKSAHGEQMSKRVAVPTRKNAGLSI